MYYIPYFATDNYITGAEEVDHGSLTIHDGTRALALGKRTYSSCRSKCSAKSCCQLGPSDSDDEDTEGSDLIPRSLERRTLFNANSGTVDVDIVKEFTDKNVKLIYTSSAGRDDSTSAWRAITNRSPKFNLGLSALCGCTTLIVYSQNGAYGAHFFEAAAWGEGDDAFKENVVDFLQNSGKGSGGLAEFADRLTKGNADVAAYILTPQAELPDEDPEAPGYVPGIAMYADQVQELVDLLPNIIPQLRQRIQVNHYQALEGGTDDDGNDINPQEAELLDNTSRGRVLFQYDPQDQGQRIVRLFFETTLIFSRSLGAAASTN
ncbi:hypothetical protein FHL15_005669 [Xylaria flabelliformis]|uniref:Uncharacterized protein n=1 Tax=Xylaria flabelliformis TaxID=2512241 RepID=A0A553HZL4_9PEZI|nr:hypothetical protein FHL15_005669 [Xylaria flabelliformis]